MPIKMWLRELDKKLFQGICNIELSEYSDSILTGQLENPGILSKIGKQFVLGKKGIWVTRRSDQGLHFVHIKNNSAYPTGLILSPYSAEDVHSHLGGRTIDKRTNIDREELVGSDTDDFVERAFKTYHSPLIRRNKMRDSHLVLYSTLKADFP